MIRPSWALVLLLFPSFAHGAPATAGACKKAAREADALLVAGDRPAAWALAEQWGAVCPAAGAKPAGQSIGWFHQYNDEGLPLEARALARSTAENARQQGMTEVTESPEPFMNAARQRVAAGLLVGEIARQNKLSLDPARVRETMQLIASTYEDPSQVIELYRNDPNLMRNLQNRVMEEQVIDWIAERANASEQPMSFADVMRPAA